MANDLTKNPWIVDTASATNLTDDKMRLRSIRWTGATAGNAATVADGAGRTIWSSLAEGPNIPQVKDFPERGLDVAGLRVPTLASGTLYLEYA